MIRFDSDYIEGCIPEILNALNNTNDEQTVGYGEDEHCAKAKALIKKAIANKDSEVYFLCGGTQANVTIISSILKAHQGAICADSGHINTHESGAIEACGYKCLTIPSSDGKIYANEIEKMINDHFDSEVAPHMVQPGIIYISFPTENGTIYSKKELTNISKVARKYNIPLFIDGARLGYGLASPHNDLTIKDLAKLCDVFYIGGTKVGALFGEAVVITNKAYQKDFKYHIKQHGGMLAKGRLLGIQFEELFKNDKYMEISKHCIDMATYLSKGFKAKGYKFKYEAETNQLFPIISKKKIAELKKNFSFQYWESYDENSDVVRFVTSFMTKKENIDSLINAL